MATERQKDVNRNKKTLRRRAIPLRKLLLTGAVYGSGAATVLLAQTCQDSNLLSPRDNHSVPADASEPRGALPIFTTPTNPTIEPPMQNFPAPETPTPVVEKEKFSPTYINSLIGGLHHSIIHGQRRADNKDALLTPDGEPISDFSDVFPAGKNTILLGGHSLWLNERQPMYNSFTFVRDSEIALDDNANHEKLYVISQLLVLNWEDVKKLVEADKTADTLITFTSVRTDQGGNFAQLYPKDSAITRADNKDQARKLYETKDYLYWVTVSVKEN